MQVYNLISKRSGKPVANQFAIICNDGTRYFRSYTTNICKIEPNGKISLDENYWNYSWNFSRTTTKYLCQFLEMNNGQIKANVEAGIFKMTDLNTTKTYNKMYNL